MTFANYAPPAYVHPDRLGVRRTLPILWLVVHTSEQGSETVNSAEALAAYIGQPGDRPNRNSAGMVTSYYGSSYHAIADTDRVIPVVPDDYVAKAAGGGNANGLHICIPGKAAQTADQWDDEITAAMLEQVARWLADKSIEHRIPAFKIVPANLVAGLPGVCGHVDVSNAFHKSDHTDPGPNFPWAALLARVDALLNPPPPPPEPDEDEMTPEQMERLAELVVDKLLMTELNVKHGGVAKRGRLASVLGWTKNQVDELRFPPSPPPAA